MPRRVGFQTPKRWMLLAFSLAATSSRFFGGAVVSSDRRKSAEMFAMASMAAWNEASFALEGLLMPLILRTNYREAARTSLSVTGGSKLKRSFMLRHMGSPIIIQQSRALRLRCLCLHNLCGKGTGSNSGP